MKLYINICKKLYYNKEMRKVTLKRILSIILAINLLIVLCFNNTIAYINTKSMLNTKKGYWSESNKPEFYGTTKIVIKKGDSFSLNDSRYRIFARDFEDFDLTQSIQAEHNVNTEITGDYKINYSVTDSHGNTKELMVPVTVTDDSNVKPMIERTMYTLANIDNVKAMGIERGHNHDRQMLGFFIKGNSNLEIRKTAGNSNLTYTMLNNDSHTESSKVIYDQWQTITFEHDYTPFIKTLYKHPDPVKFEIQWESNDSGVRELNYYHEGDNEKEFFDKWRAATDAYAVVESYILSVLVPYSDIDKIIGHWRNGFETLDKFFEYWRNVVDAYDKTLGLDYSPEDPYDQNVNARLFVKANAHGAGSAYYAGDHIGVNKPTVASFFEANWGGLHEFGHGYQGSLGKGDLEIGEVSNNIFGYYVQTNKEIYPFPGNWLGEISKIEEKYNKVRLDGGKFLDLDMPGRLYFIINFLNAFEGPDTYAHIAKIYRRNVIEGRTMNTQDAWAIGIYDKYGVSLVDYFEAWGISISEETKYIINSGNSKNAFSMKDLVLDEDLVNKIKSDLNLDGIYGLVTSEQLLSYKLTGNGKLNIKIDNLDALRGKYIFLKDVNKEIAKIKIDSDEITLSDLPVGIYNLVVPNLIGSYTNNVITIMISNNNNTEIDISYYPVNKVNTFENDVKVQFQGLYNNDAAEVKLVNDNSNLKLNLRYRGTTLFNSGLSEDYEYAKIQVINNDDNEVYKKVVGGKGEMFSKVNVETFEVPVEIGYKLVLKYYNSDSKLKFISNLNEDYRTSYEIPKNTESTFLVTENGLKHLSMSDEDFYNEYTYRMKNYIGNFLQNVKEEEIYNKNYYKNQKTLIIHGYEKMNDEDKLLYSELYNKIINGYSPIIKSKFDEIEIKINESIDLSSLIEATDVEDGIIDFADIKVETNLDNTKLGVYEVKYIVKDSDNNVSTKIIKIKVVKYNYDASTLEVLIGEIKNLNKDDYEEKSFINLQNSLVIAEKTLLRDDLTQDIVNEQIKILQNNFYSLVKVYKVTFDSKDGSLVSGITDVKKNEKVKVPVDPTKEGYIFDGWYKEESYINKWDFEIDVVTKDITLYAKWIKKSQKPIESVVDEKINQDNEILNSNQSDIVHESEYKRDSLLDSINNFEEDIVKSVNDDDINIDSAYASLAYIISSISLVFLVLFIFIRKKK